MQQLQKFTLNLTIHLTADPCRRRKECLNRFLMQREMNERDQSVHVAFKSIMQHMTTENMKQITLVDLLKGKQNGKENEKR